MRKNNISSRSSTSKNVYPFFRLGTPYRQIASGDMENGLFVRFPYRIPIIEYKKTGIYNRPVSRIKYLCSDKENKQGIFGSLSFIRKFSRPVALPFN
jgi:hypothetical protein